MKWTWLRSCYKFNMRVFVGGIEQTYPARWFFCDPDAEWFPGQHGCEASPWLKDGEKNEEWGDTGDLKQLDRGINPGYPGQTFVGDPQWFIDGQLPAEFVNQPPLCPPSLCGPLPPISTDPRCPPSPFVPLTICCQNYGPVIWHLQLDLATGQWAKLNGRFQLVLTALEFWEATLDTDYIVIYQIGHPGPFIVEIGGGDFGIPGARYTIPSPIDCFNPDVLIEAFQWNHMIPGGPPRILFLPND